MHWIVNSALAGEGGYHALIDQLERQERPYTLVRKPRGVDHLIAMHDDLDERGRHRPLNLDISGPVFVVGTISMKEVSEAHGWAPGYIDAPTQEECLANWGAHMLNHGAAFGTLADVAPPEGRDFFIRPDCDDKAFTGKVMRRTDFEEWRREALGNGSIPGETRVMTAPVRTIWAEYRCIAVDGRYVTGSRYRTGRTVAYSPDVGRMIVDFVNACLAEWNPRRALCIDVAHTDDGLKIIETNAVSSAGFYCIDMNLFVGAISTLAD